MKCPNCGSENSESGRFCFNCGASLVAPPAPEQPQAPPQVERTVIMSVPPGVGGPPPVPPVPPDPAGSPLPYSPPPPYVPPQQEPATAGYGSVPPAGAAFGGAAAGAAGGYSAGAQPTGAAGGVQMVKRSGMALASLIFGILSLIGCNILLFLPSILAVVLGFMARGQIARSGGTLTGSGLATAGIVLGIVSVVLSCLGIGLSIATGGLSFSGSIGG